MGDDLDGHRCEDGHEPSTDVAESKCCGEDEGREDYLVFVKSHTESKGRPESDAVKCILLRKST